eukprot:1287767-Rhodomonas_salina.1
MATAINGRHNGVSQRRILKSTFRITLAVTQSTYGITAWCTAAPPARRSWTRSSLPSEAAIVSGGNTPAVADGSGV